MSGGRTVFEFWPRNKAKLRKNGLCLAIHRIKCPFEKIEKLV